MNDIRWEGFTHEEIYARVQRGPGRGASADAEAAWKTTESTIRAVDAQLTRAVEQIGAEWQGSAADGVRGGMRVMSNWALDAAGDALLTRNGIAAQAEQAGFLRTAMPPPRTAEWNRSVNEVLPGVGMLSAMGDLGALEDRMANDRARAVELMNQYSSRSADNQQMMNYWTPPPSVVVEAVPTGSVPAGSAPAGPPAPGAAVSGRTASLTVARVPNVTGAAPGTPSTTSPDPRGSGPTGTATPSPGAAVPPILPPVGSPASSPPVTGARAAASTPDATARRPSSTSTPPVQPTTGAGRRSTGGVRPVVPGPPRPSAKPVDATRRTSGPLEPPVVPRTGPVVHSGVPPRSSATEPMPRATGPATEAGHGALAEPRQSAAAGRGAGSSGHGILPLAGVARPAGHEHRRPDYLLDDTDAFADDRWFTPPVIGGADAEPARA
jgi:PPE family